MKQTPLTIDREATLALIRTKYKNPSNYARLHQLTQCTLYKILDGSMLFQAATGSRYQSVLRHLQEHGVLVEDAECAPF